MLILPIAVCLQSGCETPSTTTNLVDGTKTEKEGWFRMRLEKQHYEPHEQRREDLYYHPRK